MSNESAKQGEGGPVVIDLGKKSGKRIKSLRKGEPGPLMDSINEALASLKEQGAISKTAQPVIVVVRQRASKKLPSWLG